MVGLAGYEDVIRGGCPADEQQRVALARALVIRPSVLLLDEPLSNLDAKLREGMQIELPPDPAHARYTTILVTHDQNEAMSLSDRIVVMSQGRIEQIGTPQETYERPASAFVSQFLGKTNDFTATIDRTAASARLVAGSWSGPAPAGIRGPVTISIRPERIGFGDAVCREDRHAHLPGESLAVPVRERMRPGDRDPPERRPAAACEGRAFDWPGGRKT